MSGFRRVATRLAGLVVAVSLGGVSSASGELIVNGGFELPTPLTHVWGEEYYAGSTAIPGWTILSGSVNIQASSWFNPAQGDQSLDLDGASPGAIEQSFATTIGQTYQLSFAYANNPASLGSFGGPQTADVKVYDSGGVALLSASVSHSGSTPTVMNYQILSLGFTADTAVTTLRFTSTDPASSNNGIVLDAVSVAVVPEPSAAILLGLGLSVSLIRRIGRRRAASIPRGEELGRFSPIA